MDSNEVLLCFKYIKVAKSMVNNNSQPFANLWPSAYLLRAAAAVSRPSEHYCMFEMAQKAVPVKADLITSGNVSLVVG